MRNICIYILIYIFKEKYEKYIHYVINIQYEIKNIFLKSFNYLNL